MKKMIFLVCFIGVLLNATEEYTLKYQIFSEDEKIGTLEALCVKNDAGAYKYSTRLDVEFSYMFMKYKYVHVEEAYVQNDEIVSLFVYEKDDEEVKKVRAVKDGDHLVYGDGTKVDLTMIDYLPFDLKPNLDDEVLNEKFDLRTFDSLSGESFIEKNTIIKEQDEKYHIQTIGKDNFKEDRIFLSDGTIEYIKNELFEAKLIK